MTALFSDQGLKRLDEMVRPGLLCAFDFDGTLAPIVKLPQDARLPDDVRQRLLSLSEYAPIAIITGRSVADISQRLDFEPEFVIGNHGLEGVPGMEARLAQHEALCARWREQLEAALREYAPDPGIQVEDKQFSLSLHYRLAQNPDDAARRLERAISVLTPPPRVVAGKCVYNLVAEDALNKGTALVQLMEITRASSAIYVGDDVTDEDVFRLKRDDVLSVRIEHAAHSAAPFFLPNREDINQLLDQLIARLSRPA